MDEIFLKVLNYHPEKMANIFLVDLEFETIKRGSQGFVVIFVPKSGAFNTLLTYYEYDSIFDDNSKLWRLNNLLLPLMALSEKCQGHYLLPNRSKFKEIIFVGYFNTG